MSGTQQRTRTRRRRLNPSHPNSRFIDRRSRYLVSSTLLQDTHTSPASQSPTSDLSFRFKSNIRSPVLECLHNIYPPFIFHRPSLLESPRMIDGRRGVVNRAATFSLASSESRSRKKQGNASKATLRLLVDIER